MKARNFVFAVTVFVSFVFISDLLPQWANNVRITDKKLNNAIVINDQNAIVVGDKGNVFITRDRGSTWSNLQLATSYALNGISTVSITRQQLRDDEDNYVSYIVGDGGIIYRLSKRALDISIDSDFNLKSVAFKNLNEGIAVGQKFISIVDQQDSKALTSRSAFHPANATIIVTSDGGKTWSEFNSGIRGKFNSVKYVDDYSAIAVGDKGLLAITNDDGLTWEIKSLNCTSNLNRIKFCNSNMGVIVGEDNTLFMSHDGGKIWNKISTNGKEFCNMKGICSCDGKTITVVGEGNPEEVNVGYKTFVGVILESTDFGKTWSKVFTDGGCYNNVCFCGKTFGIAIGDGGAVAIYNHEEQLEDLTDLTDNRPQLVNNYPNPFNPSTKISYKLNMANHVKIAVHNNLGEEIAVLVDAEKSPGNYEVEFNAENLPSGVYFYRIQAGQFIETRKMLLLR